MGTENSRLKVERVMSLKNTVVRDAYEWALNNIIPEIWNNSTWKRSAKGGSEKRFSEKNDMSYGMHYLTGISTAIKVIDYAISNGKFDPTISENELYAELKKSLFCFLFHDYNKVSEDSYHMENCEENVGNLLKGTKLSEIKDELELDIEDICSTAYLTEIGTSANILSQNTIGKKPLSFVFNFNTLADGISSRYSKMSSIGDIKFGGKYLIEKKEVGLVRFQSTHLFALTGLLRDSIRKYLDDTGRFFLWDLPTSMLFVGERIDSSEFDAIADVFKDRLRGKVTLEQTMEMTDRTIRMEAANIIPPVKSDLDNFIKKKFSEILHLPSGDIDESERIEYENYSREVYSFDLDGFTLNCIGKSKYRSCLMIDEIDEATDDMRIAFVIRFLQLNNNDVLKAAKKDPSYKLLEEALSHILEFSEVYSKKYARIFSKDAHKSTFLIPLIIREFRETGEKLYNSVLKYMGENDSDSVDFASIVRVLLVDDLIELSDVPDKRQMSIISGGPADYLANKSNLYGVNTQTFSNRLVPSTSLSNGKIDRLSSIENLLRKAVMRYRDSSAIMFARIPGPVPIISTWDLIKSYLQKEGHNKQTELTAPDELYVGRMEVNPQVDNSFMLSLGEMRTDSDAVRVLKLVLDFADITQMQVLVTYANAPVFGIQRESLRFEIHNSLLSSLKYDNLRFDQIAGAKNEVEIFTGIAASFYSKFSDSNTANVMREFARNPLSIFQFKNKSNGDDKKQDYILRKFKEIREMVEKRGKKMKNLEVLAEKAAAITRVYQNDSSNSKTWFIRIGLDAFEKARSSLTKGREYDLEEMEEFCAGPIWSGIERDSKLEKYKDITKVKAFTAALVKMLNEDFGGKIPSGNARSYLISAFEYMYLIKSKEMKNSE